MLKCTNTQFPFGRTIYHRTRSISYPAANPISSMRFRPFNAYFESHFVTLTNFTYAVTAAIVAAVYGPQAIFPLSLSLFHILIQFIQNYDTSKYFANLNV